MLFECFCFACCVMDVGFLWSLVYAQLIVFVCFVALKWSVRARFHSADSVSYWDLILSFKSKFKSKFSKQNSLVLNVCVDRQLQWSGNSVKEDIIIVIRIQSLFLHSLEESVIQILILSISILLCLLKLRGLSVLDFWDVCLSVANRGQYSVMVLSLVYMRRHF